MFLTSPQELTYFETKYEAAVGRRNWVIDRMIEDGYVDPDSGEAAKQKPLVTIDRSSAFVKDAQYFSEEPRLTRNCRKLPAMYFIGKFKIMTAATVGAVPSEIFP